MALEQYFRSLEEEAPGEAWRQVFQYGWPGWRDWFLRRVRPDTPTLAQSRMALRRHMPEMESLWEELVRIVDGDEVVARFLTFWCPPRYLVNCSQAVFPGEDGPMLIRNYDLDPALNEGTVLKTNWRGRRVIGMVEGMFGLADGINDAGLAVSLTFGGRVEQGPGFGVPLIIRYLLEVCTDVQDALEVLRRVPSHMSYNLILLDRTGDWSTVMMAPDRPPIITRDRFATNHQLGVEWPRHGRETHTLERWEALSRMAVDTLVGQFEAIHAFMRSPLFALDYHKGFGTVYTAVYRPVQGTMELVWPDGTQPVWGFGAFPKRTFRVAYRDGSAPGHVTELPGTDALAAGRFRPDAGQAELMRPW